MIIGQSPSFLMRRRSAYCCFTHTHWSRQEIIQYFNRIGSTSFPCIKSAYCCVATGNASIWHFIDGELWDGRNWQQALLITPRCSEISVHQVFDRALTPALDLPWLFPFFLYYMLISCVCDISRLSKPFCLSNVRFGLEHRHSYTSVCFRGSSLWHDGYLVRGRSGGLVISNNSSGRRGWISHTCWEGDILEDFLDLIGELMALRFQFIYLVLTWLLLLLESIRCILKGKWDINMITWLACENTVAFVLLARHCVSLLIWRTKAETLSLCSSWCFPTRADILSPLLSSCKWQREECSMMSVLWLAPFCMPGLGFPCVLKSLCKGTHPKMCDVPQIESFLFPGFQTLVSPVPKPTQCNVRLLCHSSSVAWVIVRKCGETDKGVSPRKE